MRPPLNALQQSVRNLGAGSDTLLAIREGLLWLVTPVLVAFFFLALSILGDACGAPSSMVQVMRGVHQGFSGMFPFLVAASVGYILAIRQRLPRIPTALLCVIYLTVAQVVFRDYPTFVSAVALLAAMALPAVCVPLLARLSRWRCLGIAHVDGLSTHFNEAIGMLLPGMLTGLALLAVTIPAASLPGLQAITPGAGIALEAHPFLGGAMVALLNSLCWFFGVHGSHALQFVFQPLDAAVGANAALLAHGSGAPHLLTGSLLNVFVFVGGSGATFSLSLALLLSAPSPRFRKLAVASLPLTLLNVNEILLFGLPIILNPRWLLPFCLVPVLNVLVALAAVALGVLPPMSVEVPFSVPLFVNAWLASGGQWQALGLQVLLVAMGTLIYLPFVRAEWRSSFVALPALNATFEQLEEEVDVCANNPLNQALATSSSRAEINQRIRRLGDCSFFLEFQPSIDLATGACHGCEALIRGRDAQGRAMGPGEFVGWFERAGLMKSIDLWVAESAARQSRAWLRSGLALPMTINVTGQTLCDRGSLARLIAIVRKANGLLSVEITEQSLVGDPRAVGAAIEALHLAGGRVYLDDFGTGFSSLSYLHQFSIDTIKVDTITVDKYVPGATVYREKADVRVPGYRPPRRGESLPGHYDYWVDRTLETIANKGVLDGHDRLYGIDQLSLTDGDDTVTCSVDVTKGFYINGGTGNDSITTGKGNDVIFSKGSAGNLLIDSGAGDDYVKCVLKEGSGGRRDDTVRLGDGNDVVKVDFSGDYRTSVTRDIAMINGDAGVDTLRTALQNTGTFDYDMGHLRSDDSKDYDFDDFLKSRKQTSLVVKAEFDLGEVDATGATSTAGFMRTASNTNIDIRRFENLEIDSTKPYPSDLETIVIVRGSEASNIFKLYDHGGGRWVVAGGGDDIIQYRPMNGLHDFSIAYGPSSKFSDHHLLNYINGGEGNDTIQIMWSALGKSGIKGGAPDRDTSGVFISLDPESGYVSWARDGWNEPKVYDRLRNVESVVLGEDPSKREGVGNNWIEGSKYSNTIQSLRGDDRLYGFAGNDWLVGGGGNDSMYGGDDNDVISVAGLSSEKSEDMNHIDGGAGGDTVDYSRSYIPLNEPARGYFYAGSEGRGVNIDLSTGFVIKRNDKGLRADRLVSIESAIGSEAGDIIQGSADDNMLDGGYGNDIISGGGGDDQILGGSGNGDDTLRGDAGNDSIVGGYCPSPGRRSPIRRSAGVSMSTPYGVRRIAPISLQVR